MHRLDHHRLKRVVERLLAPRDRPDGPGMTLGLVMGDELIVHHSVGLASIEQAAPVGPGTTFRIASVSKQFTCAAILLLAEEDKLRVTDPVGDWLPELPDTYRRITLDHLMRNTAGIRDMLEIMRAGGVDLSQPCTAEDLLDGVYRQRALNFAPGSRYLYSNSNFMLLGRVVEKASGTSLRAFLDIRIFAPLGMNATRHADGVTEPVPGLATGYFPSPHGGWRRAVHNFPLHGEGGLVSCVENLALWHAHLGSAQGAALAAALTDPVPFSNGRPNAYARGVVTRDYRGVKTVEHGGLWPGYKTTFLRAPDRRLAVICISNDASADPLATAFRALDAAIEHLPEVHPPARMPPRDSLERLAGRWIDRAAGVTVDIALTQADQLQVTAFGVPFLAQPTADGRLGAPSGSTCFTLRLLPDLDALEVERDAGERAVYHRCATDAALPDGLSGIYVNEEVAADWTIDGRVVIVDGPLRRGSRWTVEPIEDDLLRIVAPTTLFTAWMDVRVLRGADGRISGLIAQGGRVRDLVFQRRTR